MRRVRVFPTRENDAAIVEHGRIPVMVLIIAEAAFVFAVRVRDVEVGDIPLACAGNGLFAGRGGEDDLAGRQVATVEMHDMLVVDGRHLTEVRAVDIGLHNVAAVAEDQFLGVPVQIVVGDVSGLEERRDFAVWLHGRKRDEFVSKMVGAAPVGGEPIAAADHDEFIKIQHRILEENALRDFVPFQMEKADVTEGGVAVGGDARPKIFRNLLLVGDGHQEARAFDGVFLREGVDLILNGKSRGFNGMECLDGFRQRHDVMIAGLVFCEIEPFVQRLAFQGVSGQKLFRLQADVIFLQRQIRAELRDAFQRRLAVLSGDPQRFDSGRPFMEQPADARHRKFLIINPYAVILLPIENQPIDRIREIVAQAVEEGAAAVDAGVRGTRREA